VDAALVEWLQTAPGRDATERAAALLAEGVPELSVTRRLRRSLAPEHARGVLALLEGRRAAAAKFEDADRLYFDRESAEQASPSEVARYTARRLAGAIDPGTTIADLGCGAGADALALAEHALVVAVDLDAARLAMCAANAAVRGLTSRIETQQADVTSWTPQREIGAAWLDPGRRDVGGRRLDPEAWSPPLSAAIEIAHRFPAAGIKLAPGIDLEALPEDGEVEFVSLRGRLVEAVLWLGAAAEVTTRATVLPAGASMARAHGEVEPLPDERPAGVYLYDPDPAVGRAGLVRRLAGDLGAWQLDAATAYLSGDEAAVTPFARRFRVLDVRPFSERGAREALAAAESGRVEVMRRGAPVDTNALERRLNAGLPGGEPVHTLALTRIEGRITAILCVRERDIEG
jgi:SAM-dependent methyltransferase